MTGLEMLLVAAIVVAVVIFVAWPLVFPVPEPSAPELEQELVRLELTKEAKYGEIRDAQLDRQVGKLSVDDWRPIDRELRAEAIEILRKIDAAVERFPADATRQVASSRAAEARGRPSL